MDIAYRPAKPEDLEEAERVVQQSGNALLVRHGGQPWPAPPPTARHIEPGALNAKFWGWR
jgi:hypothetical protein